MLHRGSQNVRWKNFVTLLDKHGIDLAAIGEKKSAGFAFWAPNITDDRGRPLQYRRGAGAFAAPPRPPPRGKEANYAIDAFVKSLDGTQVVFSQLVEKYKEVYTHCHGNRQCVADLPPSFPKRERHAQDRNMKPALRGGAQNLQTA